MNDQRTIRVRAPRLGSDASSQRSPSTTAQRGSVRRRLARDISARQSAFVLSAKFPASHETAPGQRAYQEAEREGVASEVDVEEVIALRLLAELLPEHLYERAFIHTSPSPRD